MAIAQDSMSRHTQNNLPVPDSDNQHTQHNMNIGDAQEETSERITIAIPFAVSDSILALMDTTKHTVAWQESPASAFERQPPGKIIPRGRNRQPGWIFSMLLIQLLALIYLKTTYFKRIEEYIKAYFNINLSQQLYRDQESALSLQVIIMMVNFLVSGALLIYLLINYFFHPTYSNSLIIFTQIFAGISLIYGAKYLGYIIIGNIFPFKEDISLFRFNYFLNQKLLGVVLMPFIYAAFYVEQPFAKLFLTASVLLFLISIGIRSMKGVLISIKHLKQNAFHFLLYICTFEIAPLMILIQWLHTLANNGHN